MVVTLDADLLPVGALMLSRSAVVAIAKPKKDKLACHWRYVSRHPDAVDVLGSVSDAAFGLRPDQEPARDPLYERAVGQAPDEIPPEPRD